MRTDKRPRTPQQSDHAFAHAGHPLKQLVRSTAHVFQWGFSQEAHERLAALDVHGAVYQPSNQGLLLYGRNEAALQQSVARLKTYYHDELVVGPPIVRYRDAPLRAPWMSLQVSAPLAFTATVKGDVLRREGEVRRSVFYVNLFQLVAVAPLAELLGYETWIAQRTGEQAQVQIEFAEWRTVDERGPDPAAA